MISRSASVSLNGLSTSVSWMETLLNSDLVLVVEVAWKTEIKTCW
jgi:hypothetical protein